MQNYPLPESQCYFFFLLEVCVSVYHSSVHSCVCGNKQTNKQNQTRIGVETSYFTQEVKNSSHESVMEEPGLFNTVKQRLSRSIIVIYKYARGVNVSNKQELVKDKIFT